MPVSPSCDCRTGPAQVWFQEGQWHHQLSPGLSGATSGDTRRLMPDMRSSSDFSSAEACRLSKKHSRSFVAWSKSREGVAALQCWTMFPRAHENSASVRESGGTQARSLVHLLPPQSLGGLYYTLAHYSSQSSEAAATSLPEGCGFSALECANVRVDLTVPTGSYVAFLRLFVFPSGFETLRDMVVGWKSLIPPREFFAAVHQLQGRCYQSTNPRMISKECQTETVCSKEQSCQTDLTMSDVGFCDIVDYLDYLLPSRCGNLSGLPAQGLGEPSHQLAQATFSRNKIWHSRLLLSSVLNVIARALRCGNHLQVMQASASFQTHHCVQCCAC